MTDDLRQFVNRLRILRSIDLHELDEAALPGERVFPRMMWRVFRRDPGVFVMQRDDILTQRVWRVVQRREAPDPGTRKAFKCACCGSPEAGYRANSSWDVARQAWVLKRQTDLTWCPDCGEDVGLEQFDPDARPADVAD